MMKRNITILSLAAVSGVALLISSLMLAGKLGYSSVFDSTPWPYLIMCLLLSGVVGYISKTKGWLLGMLSILSVYTLIFLFVGSLIGIEAVAMTIRGESVIHLIKMNTSLYGLQQAVVYILFVIVLPTALLGLVGGAIGEYVRKRNKNI